MVVMAIVKGATENRVGKDICARERLNGWNVSVLNCVEGNG